MHHFILIFIKENNVQRTFSLFWRYTWKLLLSSHFYLNVWRSDRYHHLKQNCFVFIVKFICRTFYRALTTVTFLGSHVNTQRPRLLIASMLTFPKSTYYSVLAIRNYNFSFFLLIYLTHIVVPISFVFPAYQFLWPKKAVGKILFPYPEHK